jgi:hypothetical protein
LVFILSFNSFEWSKSFDPYSSHGNFKNSTIVKEFSLSFNVSLKSLTSFSFFTY